MSMLTAYAPSVNLVSVPRSRAGRFASPDNIAAITTVRLPGNRIGFQVGPRGLIFATKAAARRYAAVRTGGAR